MTTLAARAEAFLESMSRIEYFTLERLWHELTDDELYWEPVPGAWGIRRRSECRTSEPFGNGDVVADFGPVPGFRPGIDVEPMTTIGWLLWHVGSMPGRLVETEVFGGPHAVSSGWHSPYLTHHEIPETANRAVENLRSGWTALRDALEVATDDQLLVPTARYTYASAPPADGLRALGPPGPSHPAQFFVASVINEVSHHGSQICTLRDLYAHHR